MPVNRFGEELNAPLPMMGLPRNGTAAVNPAAAHTTPPANPRPPAAAPPSPAPQPGPPPASPEPLPVFQKPAAGMARCPNCGTESPITHWLNDFGGYCPKCGIGQVDLPAAATAAAPPPAPAPPPRPKGPAKIFVVCTDSVAGKYIAFAGDPTKHASGTTEAEAILGYLEASKAIEVVRIAQ